MKQKFLIPLSLGAILFASASLTKATANQTRAEGGADALWTDSSAEKVLQEQEARKGEASLTLEMARNEYESGQIYFHSQNGISSVQVSCSDLVSPLGEKIPSSEVSLYWEKYVEVSYPSNAIYPVGEYPDALIPFSLIEAKGENRVEAGKNQGIYVKVHAARNLAPGDYAGKVSLNFDGKSQDVPLSVKVWDFLVPETVHTKSCFLCYPVGLMAGEGDSSMEEYRRYYDFFLNYRVSLMNLPSSLEPSSFRKAVRDYYFNPRVSAFNLPYVQAPSEYGLNLLRSDLKSLVALSVEDHVNYLSKAYVYNLYDDEYSMKGDGEKYAAWYFSTQFGKLCQNLVSFFDTNYGRGYLDSVPSLRTSLANVLNLEVTSYVDEINYAGMKIEDLSNAHNGICPLFNVFQDETTREFYHEKYSHEDHRELWWYGCNNPVYPYPSYQIDDNGLSPRLISWMQFDYGIDGNLYYEVNKHYSESGTYLPYPGEAYGNANHDRLIAPKGVNGDGYLVYPGRSYGSKDPFPSLRLEAIRDGLEEYEYLYALEEKLGALGKSYGLSGLSAQNALRSVFDTLYTGVIPTKEEVKLAEARRKVIEAMSLADLGIVVRKTEEEASYFEVTMDFPVGASVQESTLPSNATLVSQESASTHEEFVFRVNKENGKDTRLDFSYLLSGESAPRSYASLLAEASYLAYAPAEGDDLSSYFRIASGDPAATPKLEKEGDVTYVSFPLTQGESSTLTYPYALLKRAFIQAKIDSGATRLIFRLYNPNDEDISLRVEHLHGESASIDVSSTPLKAKRFAYVSIPAEKASDYGWIRLELIPEKATDEDGNAYYEALDAKLGLAEVRIGK